MKKIYKTLILLSVILLVPGQAYAVEGDETNNGYYDANGVWIEEGQNNTDNGTNNYNSDNATGTSGYYDSNGVWVEDEQNNSNNNSTDNWNNDGNYDNSTNGYYDSNGVWVEGNQDGSSTYNEENNSNNSNSSNGYYDSNGTWVPSNDESYNQDQTYQEPETYEEPATNYEEPEVYSEPYIEETEPVEEPVEEEVAEEEEESEGVSIKALEGEGHTISGFVTSDSEPKSDVVVVLSDGQESLEVSTNEEGEFFFEDISSGTYNLNVKESDDYTIETEELEVEVGNRDKLGYEFEITEVVESEPKEAEEDQETDTEEEPVESAETDDKAETAENEEMSSVELILISAGVILLAATIIILIFRKFSNR